jgi:hypothetical protein
MRSLLTTLALAGALLAASIPAHAGKLRAQQQWGGRDLPFSCATVRAHAEQIRTMSPETRRYWIAKLGISRKMMRQARSCLK